MISRSMDGGEPPQKNILKFEREFPGALEVILDQNYRSINSIF